MRIILAVLEMLERQTASRKTHINTAGYTPIRDQENECMKERERKRHQRTREKARCKASHTQRVGVEAEICRGALHLFSIQQC